VSLAKRVGGVETTLGAPQPFAAIPLGTASLPPADRKALLAFEEKTGRLQRAVLGAVKAAAEAQTRIDHLKKALTDSPGADPKLSTALRAIEARLKDVQIELSGDTTRASRNEPTPPSIADRVATIVGGHWDATSAPTATHRRNYDIRRGNSRRSCRSCAARCGPQGSRTMRGAGAPGLRPRPRLETGIGEGLPFSSSCE
jgi:hypothetical protein